jgi:hypothetical protein
MWISVERRVASLRQYLLSIDGGRRTSLLERTLGVCPRLFMATNMVSKEAAVFEKTLSRGYGVE